MIRTALLFGSFNPIHNGHLIVSSYIADIDEVEEVWIVVSPQNPLKQTSELAPEATRLEMVAIAVQNDPRIKVCNIEFSLPRPSFTIHTLEALISKHPDRSFDLVLGSDILPSFHLWKDYLKILGLVGIIIYPRISHVHDEGLISWEKYKLRRLDSPLIEISSTYIRNRIKSGKSIKYLLPETVENYILKNNLYSPKA